VSSIGTPVPPEGVAIHDPDQKLWVEYTPPKHKCGTHGEHAHWMVITIPGQERTPAYCLQCMIDFLDRQSIGKVYLKEDYSCSISSQR
jgi:hypothetical protein